MNDEQKTVALWVRGHAEKLVAGQPERLKTVQAAENKDADRTGRQPRLMKVESYVEVPVPVLAAVLDKIGDKLPDDPVVAEHVTSYRQSCEFHQNLGTTNLLANQFIAVLDAAGVKEQAVAAVATPKKNGGDGA